jgi:dephospho-CoA kinase
LRNTPLHKKNDYLLFLFQRQGTKEREMSQENRNMRGLPKIIALCGKMRSGKDTVADYLTMMYGYKKVKFAEPLKKGVQAFYGFSDEQMETTKDVVDNRWGITPRKAMQFFGCEVCQQQIQQILPDIGRTFFVKSLLAKYEGQKIVISDMRFLHEFEAIDKIPGSLIIKIERDHLNHAETHISEIEVEKIQTKYTISNNKDLEYLYGIIETIIAT